MVRLRPINLSNPSADDLLAAMDLLDESGVQQTLANIQIALEELHRAWLVQMDLEQAFVGDTSNWQPIGFSKTKGYEIGELPSFATPEDAATEAAISDHAHDGA